MNFPQSPIAPILNCALCIIPQEQRNYSLLRDVELGLQLRCRAVTQHTSLLSTKGRGLEISL